MKKANYEQQAKEMTVFNVATRQHVIMPFRRINSLYADPDYMKTGRAFVGVIKIGQTFDQFKKEWILKKNNLQFIN